MGLFTKRAGQINSFEQRLSLLHPSAQALAHAAVALSRKPEDQNDDASTKPSEDVVFPPVITDKNMLALVQENVGFGVAYIKAAQDISQAVADRVGGQDGHGGRILTWNKAARFAYYLDIALITGISWRAASVITGLDVGKTYAATEKQLGTAAALTASAFTAAGVTGIAGAWAMARAYSVRWGVRLLTEGRFAESGPIVSGLIGAIAISAVFANGALTAVEASEGLIKSGQEDARAELDAIAAQIKERQQIIQDERLRFDKEIAQQTARITGLGESSIIQGLREQVTAIDTSIAQTELKIKIYETNPATSPQQAETFREQIRTGGIKIPGVTEADVGLNHDKNPGNDGNLTRARDELQRLRGEKASYESRIAQEIRQPTVAATAQGDITKARQEIDTLRTARARLSEDEDVELKTLELSKGQALAKLTALSVDPNAPWLERKFPDGDVALISGAATTAVMGLSALSGMADGRLTRRENELDNNSPNVMRQSKPLDSAFGVPLRMSGEEMFSNRNLVGELGQAIRNPERVLVECRGKLEALQNDMSMALNIALQEGQVNPDIYSRVMRQLSQAYQTATQQLHGEKALTFAQEILQRQETQTLQAIVTQRPDVSPA